MDRAGRIPLTITTPVGIGHRTKVVPGSNQDSGSIFSEAFGLGTASVPLTYSHIGATAVVTLAGQGDIVEFNGTSASDTFAIAGNSIQISNATNGFVTNRYALTNIFRVEARGHDGDDVFNVAGSLAALTDGLVIEWRQCNHQRLAQRHRGRRSISQSLEFAQVSEVGSERIVYAGIETMNVNALMRVIR